jgi:molybdopterin-guanine dinucleotide biosynthesis protein B
MKDEIMPPVILFVGTGKVGKTTFIEKLIPELVGRGYRVATIKHTVHKTSFDRPEKDTARHIAAGSSATAIASPSEFVMMVPGGGGMSVEDMVRHLGDNYDIVIAEGFKHEAGPKIEVHRREKGEALAATLEGVVAVITDEPLNLALKQFSLEDIKKVADLIEEGYIKPFRKEMSINKP